MITTHDSEIEQKEATPTQNTVENGQSDSSARPQPGPPLSFERALKMTLKKYDNALRELAK